MKSIQVQLQHIVTDKMYFNISTLILTYICFGRKENDHNRPAGFSQIRTYLSPNSRIFESFTFLEQEGHFGDSNLSATLPDICSRDNSLQLSPGIKLRTSFLLSFLEGYRYLSSNFTKL